VIDKEEAEQIRLEHQKNIARDIVMLLSSTTTEDAIFDIIMRALVPVLKNAIEKYPIQSQHGCTPPKM
jgi:hypothetical protein